jgi:hypothetical protein
MGNTNMYRILVWKPLGRPARRWKEGFKWILQKQDVKIRTAMSSHHGMVCPWLEDEGDDL